MNKATIIGWGMAGATLAWQLHKRKITFEIFDNGNNHSSRVAAGLVNPIVFKRLTKSWQADLLMPYAEKFYTEIEKKINAKLLSRKNIFSVFSSVEDENNWSVKNSDERFESFMGQVNVAKIQNVNCNYGLGEVKTFGNLDTNLFLDLSKKYFIDQSVNFSHEDFDYNSVTNNSEINFFFCEGHAVKNNPWFNYLPMKPTHGEVLIIEAKDLTIDFVLSKNMFVLPLGNNQFKIGATYNWELDEPITTEEGKKELLEKFESFIKCEYKIISHQAGIRPTTHDRRPILGTHPTQNNTHIFNGLGTKGVLIAPYYSDVLLAKIFDSLDLEKEVDIARFKNT